MNSNSQSAAVLFRVCAALAVISTVTSSVDAAPKVFLVSTRHLPTHAPYPLGVCPTASVRVKEIRRGKLRASSREKLLDKIRPGQPLCIFVHGNRMTEAEAIGQGVCISERIQDSQASCFQNEPAMQFIIWSWPSEIVNDPIHDARSKAIRSDAESFYLADFMAELPADQQLSVIGYSFGARVASGAVHLLGGGQLAGNTLTRPSCGCRPRVILFAAAYPAGWLTPTGPHGLTLIQAERVTSFYNPRDPALRHYNLVLGKYGSYALGYRGVNPANLGPARDNLHQYNIERTAGSSHALNRFVDSQPVMNEVSLQVFGNYTSTGAPTCRTDRSRL